MVKGTKRVLFWKLQEGHLFWASQLLKLSRAAENYALLAQISWLAEVFVLLVFSSLFSFRNVVFYQPFGPQQNSRTSLWIADLEAK